MLVGNDEPGMCSKGVCRLPVRTWMARLLVVLIVCSVLLMYLQASLIQYPHPVSVATRVR